MCKEVAPASYICVLVEGGILLVPERFVEEVVGRVVHVIVPGANFWAELAALGLSSYHGLSFRALQSGTLSIVERKVLNLLLQFGRFDQPLVANKLCAVQLLDSVNFRFEVAGLDFRQRIIVFLEIGGERFPPTLVCLDIGQVLELRELLQILHGFFF